MNTNTATAARRTLAAADILDLRDYEHNRATLQDEAMRARRLRRVTLGPIVSATFENHTTLRHQIHEMLRVERSLAVDAVDAEIAVYAPLMPSAGELSLTVLIELTDPDSMARWLSDLAGIETCFSLRTPDGTVWPAHSEHGHAKTLTRSDVTASVHYLRIPVPGSALDSGTLLVVDHPAYRSEITLTDGILAELRADIA